MAILESIHGFLLRHTKQKVVVVEVIESRNLEGGSFYCNALFLKKEGNEIMINSRVDYCDIDQLNEWILSLVGKAPIIININGDKIIHKIINTDIEDESKLVQEMIPNANAGLFYCQIYPLTNDKKIISVIRKNFLELILEKLKPIEKSVIAVSLGPFFLLETYQYIFQEDENAVYDAKFENYSLLISNGDILGYDISTYTKFENVNNFNIAGSENISSRHLIAYSYGIYHILHPLKGIGLKLESVIVAHNEVNYKKFSKVFMQAAAAALFTILIISSTIFTVYQKKYDDLIGKISYNKTKWEDYQAKKRKDIKQQELLFRNGLFDSSNIAYYADQLTFNIPQSIYLRKMQIYPVNTKTLTDNIDFITSKIFLEGNCYSGNDLNDWIFILKANTWVKSVIIKDYKQSKDEMATFVLEITKDAI